MESLDFIRDLRDTLKQQNIKFLLVSSRKNRAGEFINDVFLNIDDPEQLRTMVESLSDETKKFIENGNLDKKILKNAEKKANKKKKQ